MLTGEVLVDRAHVAIFPASHYATGREKMEAALKEIEKDMEARVAELKAADRLVEAQRLEQRTRYDMEMMQEIGYCQGIENYSRYFDGRAPGQPPFTLLDYFPKDFLLMIDESHVTIPQIRAMYRGDLARKTELVNMGSGSPAPLTTGPCGSRSFRSGSTR